MKRPLEPIIGDVVRLRPLQEADLELTRRWRNQDHIRRWFFYDGLVSPEQHRLWFVEYNARDDDFLYIIETPGRMAVGQVALYNIDWETKRAEFGRLMIGDAAGKGLGFAASRLILDFAFDRLGLREIYLEVYAHNAPAIAIYEKCGFRRTGSYRYENGQEVWQMTCHQP